MFKHRYLILAILLPFTGGLIFSPLGLWALVMALCLWPCIAFIANLQEKHDQKVAQSQSPQAANAKEQLQNYSQANGKRHLIGVSHSIARCFFTIPWLICWFVIGLWCVEPGLFLERITLIYSEISNPEHSHLILFAMTTLSTSAGSYLWFMENNASNKSSFNKNQNISSGKQSTTGFLFID
ncbi:hypothetical protein FJQ87_18640 (plasmid) [Shewanella sp. SNU WT4]|uniref:hypothetical protein n=1 Tax=Shewanella sp. SNU WT4 TaxID=2590015 RepID=UPI00112C53DD|nr:hypothetical protein [Shewanella sp. SNU WT4]QDF68723.1 hypothetical protein FJQ87_18640 [Shewanella sp. SNU WT4]